MKRVKGDGKARETSRVLYRALHFRITFVLSISADSKRVLALKC
jgi:hypothetical protein